MLIAPRIERFAKARAETAPVRAAASMGARVESCEDGEVQSWQPPPQVHLSDGTRLQLYKDGEALMAAYQAIESARRLICLEVYIFASDDTGRAFAKLLCEKARQGVPVFVVYDSFGSINSDRRIFEQMKIAGVRLQEFHPMWPWEGRFSWRPFNRDHRKLLVIDHMIAGIGGLNVGEEYSGSWVGGRNERSCEAWRDNAVGIIGPGAHVFFKAFSRTWHYVTHGGRIGRAAFSAGLHDTELGVLASVAAADPHAPGRRLLYELLRSARSTIELTMAYFAPDDDLVCELCRAAQRGIRVRLMLPGYCDVPLLRLAARSFYETLLSCGIEVYERQGVILHAKTLVIDGQVTVMGSANLDYRSIEYNCEISAIIRSREFGRQMCDLFEDDARFAHKIILGEWRRRPRWDRFVQWAVSRARYWL